MKNYKLLIPGILLLITSRPISAAANKSAFNVLQCYRSMPVKLFGAHSPFGGNKVSFRWIKGKWQLPTGYASWGFVDIANGYLEANHASPQACSHTMTVYRDNRKRQYVGLTLRGSGQFETKFYRYAGKKWIDVTSQLLPPMSLAPFLKGHFPQKNQRAILRYIGRGNRSKGKYAPFSFKLPRYGTRIKIQIQMNAFYMNQQYIGNGINRMLKLLNPDKIRYLYWNMAKGKFSWKKP